MGKNRGKPKKRQISKEEKKGKEERSKLMAKKAREGIIERGRGVRIFEDTAEIIDVLDAKKAGEFKEKIVKDGKKKALITTSRKKTRKTERFAREIESFIPNSIYAERPKKHDLLDVVKDGVKHGCTHIVLVGANSRATDRLTVICLPDGPTAYFKIVKVIESKELENKAEETSHSPEVFVENFTTNLGSAVEEIISSLFEKAEYEGRQGVVFQNKRDFIFFRRYRYGFFEKKRGVKVQEIGPRFTLKLLEIQKELYRKDMEMLWSKKNQKQGKKMFYL
eukprot:GHVN01080325.1.p2 GENE.GHVN01080325.1~~GHVN01080325.1.p2  ORF type:complete len:279 (+),score=43.02 GHVN01080325.1:2-838(+)